MEEWNTPSWPFGSNPDFEQDFLPPLSLDWKVELPKPYRFGDGLRVGTGDRIYVTVRGDSVQCYDAESGDVAGDFPGCRAKEETSIFFALGRVWIRAEESGLSFSVIDASEQRLSTEELPEVQIQGVVDTDGSPRLCFVGGLFDPQAERRWEPFSNGFAASQTRSPLVYGRLVHDEDRAHACWDVQRNGFRWRVDPGPQARGRFLTVSDRYCVVLGGSRVDGFAVLRAEDGKTLWSGTFPSHRVPCFLLCDRLSRVYYVEEATLRCHDADSGEELWTFQFPRHPDTRHLIGTGEFLWFGMSESEKGKGRLYCFDKVSGEVVWTKDLPAKLWSDCMSFIGGGLQVMVGRKMCCFRAASS